MFAEMGAQVVRAASRTARSPVGGRALERAARRALDGFLGLSGDVRGAVILTADGEVLAASGDAARWGAAARALLDAANRAAGEPVACAHVATEDGEAYLVLEDGVAIAAVTERYALASLVLSDMRATLRGLGGRVG
jgi:hypothetical protein